MVDFIKLSQRLQGYVTKDSSPHMQSSLKDHQHPCWAVHLIMMEWLSRAPYRHRKVTATGYSTWKTLQEEGEIVFCDQGGIKGGGKGINMFSEGASVWKRRNSVMKGPAKCK